MPVGSQLITVDAVSNVGTATVSAEKGILTGVSIVAEYPSTQAAEAYAYVFLVSTELPQPIRIITLAAGYIGSIIGISWFGEIELEPAMGVQGFVRHVDALTFNLNVLTRLP